MTSAERLAIAATLRAMLLHLWDGIEGHGGEEYLCYALERVQAGNEDQVAALLQGRLGHSDGKARGFDDWLREVALVPEQDLTPARVQRHRAAWIELLASEFEN